MLKNRNSLGYLWQYKCSAHEKIIDLNLKLKARYSFSENVPSVSKIVNKYVNGYLTVGITETLIWVSGSIICVIICYKFD